MKILRKFNWINSSKIFSKNIHIRMVYVRAIFLVIGVFLAGNQQAADAALREKCQEVFLQEGVCPKEYCNITCEGGQITEGCAVVCLPKLCTDIDNIEFCLEEDCQILESCNGKKECYFKPELAPPVCGDIAYSGSVECCEGLEKRCGINFMDGSCDMLGNNSIYSLPICVPCGNGICNQFENHCNCPEDCEKPSEIIDQ